MIRMQKKKVETPPPKEETSSKESAPATTEASSTMEVAEADSKDNGEKVSLLGFGGRQLGGAGAKASGKKRTPGEIRIQKGKSPLPCCIIEPTYPKLLVCF
ncbi:hypothetical protein EON65_14940 [archaeon]|nr:MAG: hypothetical protein EON65_14940 [archaeon]